jgi:SAM-dependent methyltransferase
LLTIDFDRLALAPGSRILDVGCGSGRHVGEAYRRPGTLTVGVDRDRVELHRAGDRLRLHEKLGEHGGGTWKLFAADIHRLPFSGQAFDLVICSEVLEHIANHKGAVTESVRVLKSGGMLAVSVPRHWPERLCWRLSSEYAAGKGGHLRIYRRSTLVRIVEMSGTRLCGAHHAHSLHSPYWWLKCLVGPGRDDQPLVRLYQRFLTWDIMRRPRATRLLERILDPVLGKSLVLYFRKLP